jgi:hypothetical protein
MTDVEVLTKVSQRFALDRFRVIPPLVAAKHAFIFENQHVTIQLPSLEEENRPLAQRRREDRSAAAVAENHSPKSPLS